MKALQLIIFLNIVFSFSSCKSSVKEQNDKVYSRHLQRYVDLTIISTAMPDKKEEMNLLLFNDLKLLQTTRAKEIVDSLYKKKKIQPLVIVAVGGLQKDYGLQESAENDAKQFKKYNEFVSDELYPFVKKKTVIRKFNSVGICGFGTSALSSFDIAWNNDEKIGLVGMFEPAFGGTVAGDSMVLKNIDGLRKRPNLKIWVSSKLSDSSSQVFKNIIDTKKSIKDITIVKKESETETAKGFEAFLLWAYPR